MICSGVAIRPGLEHRDAEARFGSYRRLVASGDFRFTHRTPSGPAPAARPLAPPSGRRRYRQLSNSAAPPWPPPTHIVTTPYFFLRRWSSLASVPTSREPVMPIGSVMPSCWSIR